MAEITAEAVKKLREMTSAGMMDCKAALKEANGDFDSAVEVLRKKGLKDVSKRQAKVAAEGVIGTYIHTGEQVVSIVELNCETDFVARGDEFRQVARDLAMHVAAMRPTYLTVEEVPEAVLAKEKEIAIEQLNEAQRAKADKILPGKLEKFYEEVVLFNQIFVKDDSGKKTIKQVIDDLSVKTGEKVALRRFQRFEVGEGVERKSADFVADVAAMVSK